MQPTARAHSAGTPAEKFEEVQTWDYPISGFRARLYRNKQTGEYVLAFKGTDNPKSSTDTRDWGATPLQGTGHQAEQYEKAMKLAKDLKDKIRRQVVVHRPLARWRLGGGSRHGDWLAGNHF